MEWAVVMSCERAWLALQRRRRQITSKRFVGYGFTELRLIRNVLDATLIAHSPPTHLSRMFSPWRCHEPHEMSLFDTAHLLSKAAGCNELEGLHLAEMRGITKHMDVHELGHIPVTV